ncbi:hypothetical protein [Halalkalibacter krulwichiae]|uniref:hypothetical protein n=1 Tax=Halalkalibacter krulwichiae TaxID=199441 RepID=UPI0014722F6F|nr:hypothetical protein [Halalkalibacter krulwichiae]
MPEFQPVRLDVTQIVRQAVIQIDKLLRARIQKIVQVTTEIGNRMWEPSRLITEGWAEYHKNQTIITGALEEALNDFEYESIEVKSEYIEVNSTDLVGGKIRSFFDKGRTLLTKGSTYLFKKIFESLLGHLAVLPIVQWIIENAGVYIKLFLSFISKKFD